MRYMHLGLVGRGTFRGMLLTNEIWRQIARDEHSSKEQCREERGEEISPDVHSDAERLKLSHAVPKTEPSERWRAGCERSRRDTEAKPVTFIGVGWSELLCVS
jgi:hypothetical protein